MDNEKLLDRTRKDLRSVLISAPRGVPMRLLLSDYKMVLGCELPYRQLGYHRVEDLLVSIPDVVRVGRDATGEQACFAVANASTSQIARFVALQKKPKLKRSNAPPLTRKSMYTGFTKKSKFGPSSARPKASPYSGRKFSGGGGNFYNSGGPRFNRRGRYDSMHLWYHIRVSHLWGVTQFHWDRGGNIECHYIPGDTT